VPCGKRHGEDGLSTIRSTLIQPDTSTEMAITIMSAASAKPWSASMQGMAWMVASGLCFTAVMISVRHVGPDLPAAVSASIRYAMGIVFLAPLLMRSGFRFPRGQNLKLHIWRGVFHGAGVILWFYAMARIPMAEVTAISYTAPIFMTIGAVMFFGETIQVRRVGAIIAGLAGVFIILRPGFETLSSGQLAQLAATPVFAAAMLLVKRLTRSDSPAMIVIMLNFVCLAVLAPIAALTWKTPEIRQLGWLAVATVGATAGHYCLTRSYGVADITVIQPVTFLQLVWTMLFGFLLFAETPDIWVFAGGAVILAATTYIAHRERQQAIARPPETSVPSRVPGAGV
jgi:drug/metabolite transporter (DMT)-like permease